MPDPNVYGQLAQGGQPPPATYNYGAVGTGQFDSADPSVTGRVTGQSGAADIDHVNIWMRSQPWYQQIVSQYGGASSDKAKAAIIKAAQQNGVQVDQGNIEVDNSGNFKQSGMSTWGKVLIVAGIAAATIATMGAAGVFAAAGAGAESGAVGIGAAAETAGTAEGAFIGADVAGTAAAAGGAGAAAGVGAGTAGAIGAEGVVEGGALPTAGLAATGASGAEATGLSAAGATAGGAGTAAASSAPSWLGSATTGGIGAAGTIVGSYLQSKAVGDAANIQAQTAAQALAYEKQNNAYLQGTEANRYAAMMAQRAPYVASGQSANTAMASYLGLPAPPPQAATPAPPQYAPPSPVGLPTGPPNTAVPAPGTTPGPTPAPGARAPQQQVVKMRAPDGSIEDVPSTQVQHFQNLGATLVTG